MVEPLLLCPNIWEKQKTGPIFVGIRRKKLVAILLQIRYNLLKSGERWGRVAL